MLEARPETLVDPVCGMAVNVAAAEAAGLLLEHAGRTWAFCGRGCRRSFADDPAEYIARAEDAAPASPIAPGGQVVIDDGLRRWYESCSCCLSEAFPEVKAALDAEKAAAPLRVPEGICEVAEAAEVAPH
jgi:YHS domain-containing protein